ncbi:MAG: DUF881 domain-containing protein [Bacillota bacterium]|nr:DUF881 domain-containing protein [Bacillota bacterium]
MNKEKIRAYIWIGIISILLGIIISFQVKVVQNNLLSGHSPNVKSRQLIIELEVVKEKKRLLEEEVVSLENELNEIKTSISKENTLIDSLYTQSRECKKNAGMTNVHGTGVTISIDNSKDEYVSATSNIVYEYNLILNLINELNAAGAEAISINDQRIVNTTEIRTAGNSLMINKIPVIAPIEIKAIGDIKTLSASINQRFGIVSIIRDKGYFIETFQSDDVVIAKYDGTIEFEYIQNTDN